MINGFRSPPVRKIHQQDSNRTYRCEADGLLTIEEARTMLRNTRTQWTLLGAMTISIAVATVVMTADGSDRYVTVSPQIEQRFVSIPSESALVDLCYRLQNIYGVTGVSYRNYSATDGSALVTVFYNPSMTNNREIRIFMRHPYVLWDKPRRT
jgi:hypothetical protein